MADDFLDELGDEMKAAYHPPPDAPRAELWRAVQARRALRAVYHPPPRTPREDLWTAVRARRNVARPAALPREATVPARRWLGWALPIAATLLVGISIGRFVPFADAGDPAPEFQNAQPDPPADRGEGPRAPAGAPDEGVGASGAGEGEAPPAGEAARAAPGPPAVGGFAAVREGPASGLAAAGAREASTRLAASPRTAEGALYRVAALETLGGAEALLGAVGGREGGALPAEAAAIADWSEDMLSETRLLMDSPAGDDPAIGALLEDLELVLAQLVRLGEGATAEGDLALIEGAVRERQLLHRIRAVLPAGPITSGT